MKLNRQLLAVIALIVLAGRTFAFLPPDHTAPAEPGCSQPAGDRRINLVSRSIGRAERPSRGRAKLEGGFRAGHQGSEAN